MADTKTRTNTKRGGPRRPPGRPDGGGPATRGTTRGTLRAGPIRPEEVVSWSRPDAASFAGLFAVALRLAYAGGADSPALAFSRAACSTWRSASVLDPEDAARTRGAVFREILAERGEEPLRCGDPIVFPDEGGGLLDEEPEDAADADATEAEVVPRVPRGRALDGDRHRNGGKR